MIEYDIETLIKCLQSDPETWAKKFIEMDTLIHYQADLLEVKYQDMLADFKRAKYH